MQLSNWLFYLISFDTGLKSRWGWSRSIQLLVLVLEQVIVRLESQIRERVGKWLHCIPLRWAALGWAAAGWAGLHALHCTALHCTALGCTALHCTALHCTALHCSRKSIDYLLPYQLSIRGYSNGVPPFYLIDILLLAAVAAR
uniref:Uncharacterized protein orf142 n=1 Tax=Chlorokybus atmophyticus TaxID=3144 RepID=A6YE92_CHLAT|nr:hypothetical protein Chatpmp20 [Chlorokybus atmophyticus]ABO15136.1 hypothetical protein [Chlorokybus atmophyticus]